MTSEFGKSQALSGWFIQPGPPLYDKKKLCTLLEFNFYFLWFVLILMKCVFVLILLTFSTQI